MAQLSQHDRDVAAAALRRAADKFEREAHRATHSRAKGSDARAVEQEAVRWYTHVAKTLRDWANRVVR